MANDASADSPDEKGANPASVYLDSCFYLHYLKGDTERHVVLDAVFREWRAGRLPVVTSALTVTEVLWVRCNDDEARMVPPRAEEAGVLDLFSGYPPRQFTLVELDRVIAEAARDLVWNLNIKPKDAVHVASALKARVPMLFTTDQRLWRHTRQVGGDPLLRIERPAWTTQAVLEDQLPDVEGERQP